MEDSVPQIIHTNRTVLCPECMRNLIVGIEYQLPRITAVVSEGACATAKEEVRKAIGRITGDKDMAEVNAWLDREDTVITPGDVQTIIAKLTWPEKGGLTGKDGDVQD